MVLALGGSAFAQGLSLDTKTRGSGSVGTSPGHVGGSMSGSNRVGGHVTAPGVGAGVGTHTTGQGSVGVGGAGARGNLGVGGNARGGVRIRR
jgi:hypothetical protein